MLDHNGYSKFEREAGQVQRMRELDAENLRLRHTVADLAMQNATILSTVTEPR